MPTNQQKRPAPHFYHHLCHVLLISVYRLYCQCENNVVTQVERLSPVHLFTCSPVHLGTIMQQSDGALHLQRQRTLCMRWSPAELTFVAHYCTAESKVRSHNNAPERTNLSVEVATTIYL